MIAKEYAFLLSTRMPPNEKVFFSSSGSTPCSRENKYKEVMIKLNT